MKRYIKNASSTSSIFTSWNEAYDIILKVVDKYLTSDPDAINSKITLLDEIFKNDRNWDEAYVRWLDSKNETSYEDTEETMLEDSSRYLED